jgi:hypothetical protein
LEEEEEEEEVQSEQRQRQMGRRAEMVDFTEQEEAAAELDAWAMAELEVTDHRGSFT